MEHFYDRHPQAKWCDVWSVHCKAYLADSEAAFTTLPFSLINIMEIPVLWSWSAESKISPAKSFQQRKNYLSINDLGKS